MSSLQKSSRPIAFVAMKFDSDHWRDERYKVIQDELTKAGYDCKRADELRTSGPVVDEVCHLLKNAHLVVIDSSYDSHSVSYEIGYCHGIGRSADKTLLLRNDDKIPFNYRHYRHRVYKDKRELRRYIRDYLKLYEPLSNDHLGYSFAFKYSSGTNGFIKRAAHSIFHALCQQNISGRCECYSGYLDRIPGNYICVGIMLRLGKGKEQTPDYDWWLNIQQITKDYIAAKNIDIELQDDMSELNTKKAMKEWLIPTGIAEFSNGRIVRILGEQEDCLLSSFSHSI
jgi:hypothetical protein